MEKPRLFSEQMKALPSISMVLLMNLLVSVCQSYYGMFNKKSWTNTRSLCEIFPVYVLVQQKGTQNLCEMQVRDNGMQTQ